MNGAQGKIELLPSDKYHRWWDWFSALLLIILIETAAARLVSTDWAEKMSLVQDVAFWGTLLGLALGKSAFRRLTVFLMSLNFGVFVLAWQIGMLVEREVDWDERMVTVGERMSRVIQDVMARKPVLDNILFLGLMALLFWVLSVYAGYQMVRYGHMWRVVLPPGLAAFVIQAFDNVLNRRTWTLGVYLFLALVIIARTFFLRMRHKWDKSRTHVPPDVDLELGRMALVISLVLILFIWNFPSLASAVGGFSNLKTAVEAPWEKFKDRMSYMFNSLRSSSQQNPAFYGSVQGLGRGIPLSDDVIFTVKAPSYPMVGGHYYWRARSYDTYQNAQWTDGQIETVPFDPQTANRDVVFAEGRTPVTVQFTTRGLFGTLLTPPSPHWVDRKGELVITQNPDQSQDLLSFTANPAVRSGETYVVQASATIATQGQLRSAGTNYPTWVLSRYRQIPETITARTRQLALDITRPYTNPYDKAEAITAYLRANIAYIDQIEPPPTNQDVIDWFLFDYRKGFCNYYATAEVILLRAAGVPARWVVGYAQGEPIPSTSQPTIEPGVSGVPENLVPAIAEYSVRQSDAHSWPEVYFPGTGWVEFEPTVSISPILRPRDLGSLTDTQNEVDRLRERERNLPEEAYPLDLPNRNNALSELQLRQQRIRQALTAVAVVIIILGIAVLRMARNPRSRLSRWWKRISQIKRPPIPVRLEGFLRRLGFTPPEFLRRWAAYALLPLLGRAYQEINTALNRLGKPAEVSDTPSERTESLAAILPEAASPARQLLSEYQAYSYSTHPANALTARLKAQEIRHLSIAAWFRNKVEGLRNTLSKKFEV